MGRYCPKCLTEYRDGFDVCHECRCPLEDRASANIEPVSMEPDNTPIKSPSVQQNQSCCPDELRQYLLNAKGVSALALNVFCIAGFPIFYLLGAFSLVFNNSIIGDILSGAMLIAFIPGMAFEYLGREKARNSYFLLLVLVWIYPNYIARASIEHFFEQTYTQSSNNGSAEPILLVALITIWLMYFLYIIGWLHANVALLRFKSMAKRRLSDLNRDIDTNQAVDTILERGLLEWKALGNSDRALFDIACVINQEGGDPQLLDMAATLLSKKRRYGEAKSLYLRALERTIDRNTRKKIEKRLKLIENRI